MLSRLLNVYHPTAKQAVITAIDLLGLYKYAILFGSVETFFLKYLESILLYRSTLAKLGIMKSHIPA